MDQAGWLWGVASENMLTLHFWDVGEQNRQSVIWTGNGGILPFLIFWQLVPHSGPLSVAVLKIPCIHEWTHTKKSIIKTPRRHGVNIFILLVHWRPSSVFVHWRHQLSISTLHAEDWTRTGSRHTARSQITLLGPRLKIRLEKIRGFGGWMWNQPSCVNLVNRSTEWREHFSDWTGTLSMHLQLLSNVKLGSRTGRTYTLNSWPHYSK